MWKPQPYWLNADWMGLGHRGSATTGEDRVPCPFHRIPSNYLQLRQTGDENRVLPGRHSPAWCENLSWGSYTTPAPRSRVQPPRFTNIPSRYVELKKRGHSYYCCIFFIYPNPGTPTFHLTPRRDTVLHSVGTQPPGTRLTGSARVRGRSKPPH